MEQIFERKLFGGIIKIIVFNSERFFTKDLIEEAYQEGLRLQKIFNFYDKESELSRLNKKRKMKVSSELLEVITKALKMSKETNGGYDITLGENFLKRKNKEKIESLDCSFRDVKINFDEIILENSKVLIDLGSIAKGYITDKIAEFLKSRGLEEFIIDARGDIIVSGTEKEIFIQNPRDEKENITSVKLKNQAIATSGDYNQFDEDFSKSHILNQGENISISIIADNLEEADLFATALFVSNRNYLEHWFKRHKNLKGIAIDKNLQLKKFNFDEN